VLGERASGIQGETEKGKIMSLQETIIDLRGRNAKLEALCAAYLGHWPPTVSDIARERKVAADDCFSDGERATAQNIADVLEAMVEEESHGS